MEDLKTSDEWQKICYVRILDPDGWDRKNFDYSWFKEKISKKEFEKRMMFSTVENFKLGKNKWIKE